MDNKNQLQGKMGIALIRSSDFSKIMLYRNKNDIITTKMLKSDSTVYFKREYVNFLDDSNDYWSLYFEKDDDRDAFLAIVEEHATVERESDMGHVEKKKEPSDAAIAVAAADVHSTNATGAISRVAKVGHQLPKMDVFHKNKADESDSSSSSEMQSKAVAFPMPSNTIVRPMDPPKSEVFAVPNNLLANIMMQQNNTNSSINNFLTESRVNSSESRIQMGKLESKIDRMLDKIDLIRTNVAGKTGDEKDDEILELEEKIVELKKENRLLKLAAKEVADAAVVISAPSAPQTDSKDAEAVAVLTVEVTEARRTIDDLRQVINDKDGQTTELNKKLVDLETQLKDEQAKVVAQRNSEQNNAATAGQNASLVREIMNELYQKLYQSLEERPSWPKQDILKLTADLIRNETKAVLSRQK